MINEKNNFLTVSWLSGLLSAEIFISTGEWGVQMPPLTSENSYFLRSGPQGATLVMKNHQIRGEIGLQSVLIRFCRFDVGLCSGRQICRGEIFQTCLKDLSPTNCRLSVGYMSVWCRGAFGDVSVLIRPPMVDGLSVLDRLCIGHMSADLTPIQGRFKTESSPT